MIIAITGNIGSGKSTASEIFVNSGYTLINADAIGHDLYHVKRIKDKVVKKFGKGILTHGEIERKKLKDIVFYDPKKLIELNNLVHPEIVKEINKRIRSIKSSKIVIEAALILEFNFKNYDKLILITIDPDVQMRRLLKKGKYNKSEINNIISSQMPQEKKMAYADYIVDNSGTKKELEESVKKIIEALS
jgi:dephospho-CoA kinase